MEDELSQVRNILTTNLELSVKNQQQLEIELESQQSKVQAINAQLVLAEKVYEIALINHNSIIKKKCLYYFYYIRSLKKNLVKLLLI